MFLFETIGDREGRYSDNKFDVIVILHVLYLTVLEANSFIFILNNDQSSGILLLHQNFNSFFRWFVQNFDGKEFSHCNHRGSETSHG